MKFIFLNFAFIFLMVGFTAQESLEPLRYNQTILKGNTLDKSSSPIDQTFIYLFDTLELPFIDDFSTDRFKVFDAQTSDTNVSDSLWYYIEESGIPVSFLTTYMDDTTYLYEFDSVNISGVDTMVVNEIPLNSTFITVYDINNYPVLSSVVEVWPNTSIYDSLWTVPSPDYVSVSTSPDFEQDTLNLYFVAPTPEDENYLWEDIYAYRNNTLPIDPITIGVASMDGLDENGYPYDWSSASAQGVADYLTSKPINLGTNPSGGIYQVVDSIYFSFLYQAGGFGEFPDYQDSLVLEFYSPLNNIWRSIWSTPGIQTSEWNSQHILLDNTDYLRDGFQFRFKNYGSLTGSLDHWHIDYVILDDFRSFSDTTMDDWAFQLPLNTFLENYTSIPWSHYKYDPVTPMLDSVKVTTYNSYTGAKILQPCSYELFHNNAIINTFTYQSIVTNVDPESSFEMAYDIDANFYFDTIITDTFAVFQSKFNIATNTTPERLIVNDTLIHNQVFENYYSYDDGSAEAAYGLVGNGAELAYQFELNNIAEDTIKSIFIHFSPSVNNASADPFFIQIWDDLGGQPGNLIYTTDDVSLPTTFVPEYNLGVNGFYEYFLPEPVLVSGTYYVGWKQTSANRLNVGFDKNINNQNRVFYDLGSGWSNTGFEGSLMIRPVFVSDMDPIFAGISPIKTDFGFNVYPNPSNDQLTIDLTNEKGVYIIYDLNGRVVTQSMINGTSMMDVSSWENGVYIISVEFDNGSLSREKIIIQH